MPSETLFLFTFLGVKVTEINIVPAEFEAGEVKPEDLKMAVTSVFMTQSFTDESTAKEYGLSCINMYLSPKGFHKRFCIVRDYVALGSENRAASETIKIVKDNLTEKLDPIVTDFLKRFWGDENKRNFMFRLVNFNQLDCTMNDINKLSKCVTDIILKDCKDELKQFHGKLKDVFLRNQIEQRGCKFFKDLLIKEVPVVGETLSAAQ